MSTSWSPDPATSLIDISQLFSMLLLAFLAMQLSPSGVFLAYLVPAILCGAALTAAIGIGQYFGFNPLDLRIDQNSSPATFINPNHAAVYFDFIPWLAVAAILVYRRRGLRWLAAVSFGLCLTYISINTSRGSLLALLVSGLIFIALVVLKPEVREALKSRLRQRYKEILLALVIPLSVLLIPVFQPAVKASVEQWDATLLQGKLDAPSRYRLAFYVNSLPAILDHPLSGLGYGGIRVGFQPYASRILPTKLRTENTVLRDLHSDPLQYFVELGIPGGLLAITVFLILLRSGWKTLSASQLTNKHILVLGVWLGMIAGGIHACVDFPLRLPTSAAFFWFFLGCLLGLVAKQDNTITVSSIMKKVLIVLGVGSLLFTSGFYYQYFKGSHSLYIATATIRKNDCAAAIAAIEKSISEFSLNYVTQNRYAQVYTVCDLPVETKLDAMNLVLALDPSNVRARLTRGILLLQIKAISKAEIDLLYVLEILPHRPLAYLAMGDVAVLKHDYSAARHYYSAGLKRDPNNSYAQEMLHKLEAVN